MDIKIQIAITMFLIILGLLMAADNSFHSLMIKIFFANDKISHLLTRVFGLIIIVCAMIYILGFVEYAIFSIIITFFGLVFLTIRGRSIRKYEFEKKRQDLIKDHEALMEEKREKLNRLRQRIKNADETDTASAKGKSRSIEQMKKEAWNDGSLTNKELKDQLKSPKS